MLRLYCPDRSRPEMFPGIGVLPEPATESHVVNRGIQVALLDSRKRMSRRGRVSRVGSPCSPDFPNIIVTILSCLRSPIAAGLQMTH